MRRRHALRLLAVPAAALTLGAGTASAATGTGTVITMPGTTVTVPIDANGKPDMNALIAAIVAGAKTGTTAPAPGAVTTAPGGVLTTPGAVTPTPNPAPTPGSATSGQPSAPGATAPAPTAPAATPAQPAPPAATTAAGHASRDGRTLATLLLIVAGGALLAAALTFAWLQLSGRRPRWVKARAHEIAEAGWRSGSRWPEFLDFLRLGR